MNNSLIKSFLFFLIIPILSFSQSKERTGLNYGFQLGWNSPGKQEAQLYNCNKSSNVDLNYILTGNTTNYTKLQEFYNDDFTLYELPQNIKYKSTLTIGGTLQYYTSQTFAVFFNAIYESPSITNSNFSIKLNSKKGNLSNEVIQQGVISGKESRLNFELGLHKSFENESIYHPFFDIAFVGSLLEMKSHEISIGNLKQSVLHYSQNNTNTTFSRFGYGTSCTLGVQFPINDFILYTGVSLTAIHYGIFDNPVSIAKGIDMKFLL
ncbi:MAG: hypothetical protein MJ198_04150 [Bacteroidales bacterium]|nr:hypothetical protein [Bacteroidales bacterium]